jgi:hypothetical protein
MRFTSEGVTYEVEWLVCDNPECPRREADFRFSEYDEDGDILASGVRFSVEVDLSTGQVLKPMSGSCVAAPVVEAFLAHGREGLFADLLEAQADQRRLANAVIDLKEGGLVPYATLVCGDQSILQGGRRVSFSVAHQGVTYYVEDLHCPQPKCKCQDVRLVVIGPSPTEQGEITLTTLFDAVMTLRGKLTVGDIDDPHMTPGLANAILAAFRTQTPDLLQDLRHRWQTVKEIAARSAHQRPAAKPAASTQPAVVSKTTPPTPALALAARAPATSQEPMELAGRVGRNDPCPCGSGKKYKKCCL